MNKLYVIQWKSKTNGRAGRGAKLFEQHEAEQLVHELNQEYPDIQHEAVEAGPAGTTPSPAENEPASEAAADKPGESTDAPILAVDFTPRD